ncbi:MAG TPA: MBL fold metallo-hydrolase [Burkholderiales bacterium]|nr:MBL fold metallo-hydrolase [Burkholderiales bacterium]
MSRALYAIAFGALLASATYAQDKPPLFATTKVDGTDNVYTFRYQNSLSMFVVTPAGVIVTDPIGYGRPQAVVTYLEEIRKITDKPVKYVLYSHHHFDHIAGGKPFKDAGAKFIAHKRAKERLVQLKDPHTVLPDETFDKKKTISLGGTTIEMVYMGLNHSDATAVIRLPKEKLIFTVDTVPVGQFPGRGMIDAYPLEWEDFLQKLYVMDWERLIPGHPGVGGRLGTKQDVQNLLVLMQDASAAVKKEAQEGKCWDPVEKELKLPKYASWPGYENGLPFVLRRYCALWGRGT